MTRFWPTLAGAVLSAFATIGCNGQHIEGRWVGRFPFEGAKDCEIRLEGNHSFTVDCDRDAIVGGGRYSWDGRALDLRFSILTRGGKVVRTKPDVGFTVRGSGNAIDLTRNDERFHWTRMLGR